MYKIAGFLLGGLVVVGCFAWKQNRFLVFGQSFFFGLPLCFLLFYLETKWSESSVVNRRLGIKRSAFSVLYRLGHSTGLVERASRGHRAQLHFLQKT